MNSLFNNSITNSKYFNKNTLIGTISISSILSLSTYYYYQKNKKNIEVKLEKVKLEPTKKENLDEKNTDNFNIDEIDDIELNSDESVDSLEQYLITNEKINIFCHYFNTPHKIETGLKNMKHIPFTEVGFFDMGYLNNHTLWMRDTYLSLDVIFINNNNIIVDKIENTTPLSDDSLFVNKLSSYIIEANAGFYKKFNLKIGMNINEIFNLIMII